MAGGNAALIRYYARIIQKGYWTIEQVPQEYREEVKAMMAILPPQTPVTETKE